MFSRDELADSLVLFGDGCRDKGVGFRGDTFPDAVRPLFFPFFCGTTVPGFLVGRGGNMWLAIYQECFFSKFTLTACCWLGNIVPFHIRLTRL